MKTPNRRDFLKATAATAAATAAPRLLSQVPTSSHTTPALRQLSYEQVRLLPGPMQDQFQHNHALFLALGNDRLLKPFRQLVGQPAPGDDMGGWYSPSPRFDPPRIMTSYAGHSFGQYLSSLARAYAVTGDAATQQKVFSLVRGFAATVSTKFYDGYYLPCYTFEKTLCGLLDAHRFAKDPIALRVLNAATDAVLPWLPDHALTRAEMRARPHSNEAYTWDESYTLPENLYLAYSAGAGDRYRTLARRFLQDTAFFQPLAEGRNVLPGEHAYSHVNALNSAMQAWFVDGSRMHLDAARNGFRFVQQQSYATGGWGPDESFRKPGTSDLIDSLTHTHNSFETPCGAYGHFKITRNLLCATGDSLYGDSMETVLYNTILGARPIQPDGTSCYYSDFSSDATKTSYEQKWPCCSGTFPQLTADYGISTFLSAARGIAINLYTPSQVSFRQGATRIHLTQSTSYPLDGDISLALQMDRPTRFELRLRIPAWAGASTRVQVNGRPAITQPPQPGTWCVIDRDWRNGDRVELTLDMPLRLLPLDAQRPDLVALVAGPVALFAVLPAPERIERNQLLAARRQAPKSPRWQVTTATGTTDLLPYAAIDKERYRLYLQT